MPMFRIGPEDGLRFEHAAPTRGGAPTFVFVNALTGSIDAWEAVVAPTVRAAGFGTLCYNFRGQDGSPFAADQALTPDLIISDLRALLDAETPSRPILVGLSIGGLFAAHAHLGGALAGDAPAGLVLINTLREINARIAWVNDAMPMIVEAGGVPLFLDALFPLLVNEAFAAKARANFLKGGYAPIAPDHGHLNLMRHAGAADWDLPYESLALPTLVITGLQDRVFLDRAVVDRLFARLPNATREDWPDCGHLAPQERPEALAAALERFGRGVEEGAA